MRSEIVKKFLKYETETETDAQPQRIDLWLPKERGWEKEGLRMWDQQRQTIIYRVDNQ